MNTEVIIQPGVLNRYYWKELWGSFDLLFLLVSRDIIVQYRHALLGIAWALIRPLMMALAFTFMFGKIAGISSGGLPFPVYVFAAILPWQFISAGVQNGGQSLADSSKILSKVYFPRILVPAAAVLVAFMDFFLGLIFLAFSFLWFGVMPSLNIMFLPLAILLLLSFTLGWAIFLSALNVRYLDVRHVVPFLLQFGLYVSPIGFGLDSVPSEFRYLYSINPVVGIIELFRYCLLDVSSPLLAFSVFCSAVWSSFILAVSFIYFRRTERTIVDIM